MTGRLTGHLSKAEGVKSKHQRRHVVPRDRRSRDNNVLKLEGFEPYTGNQSLSIHCNFVHNNDHLIIGIAR